MKNQTSSSGGIGVTSLLGIIFIVLKLTNMIDWSWWWVLAPFWIPIVLVAAILLVIGIVILFIKLFK